MALLCCNLKSFNDIYRSNGGDIKREIWVMHTTERRLILLNVPRFSDYGFTEYRWISESMTAF